MSAGVIDTNSIQAVLGSLANIGNVEQFSENVRRLHHEFLKLTLKPGGEPSLLVTDLAYLHKAATLLATHYTNPFLDERSGEIPVENRADPQLLLDGRSVAATIFEFLGDYSQLAAAPDEDRNMLPPIIGLSSKLPSHSRLFLKAALMYGLSDYESRTSVLVKRLLLRLNLAKSDLSRDTDAIADYLLLALLAGGHRRIIYGPFSDLRNIAAARVSLERDLDTDEDDIYDQLLGRLASIDIIAACVLAARAFWDGDERAMRASGDRFDNAIRYISDLGQAESQWTIRTASKVIQRLWSDSPWVRLRDAIPNRRYLRTLVRGGVFTLWKSQTEALELSAQVDDVSFGYLDDRLRRIVLTLPTSAGKTLLAELAIVRTLSLSFGAKCVYVVPTRALCEQVTRRLRTSLSKIGVRVAAPVSDSDTSSYETLIFQQTSVVVLTPEKLSYLYRQGSADITEAALFIFDEVHAIAKDGRGWNYEEVITLLLGDARTARAKMLFVSAIMPNHQTFREWVDPQGVAQSIASNWQPTRTLKGALVFSGPVATSDLEVVLSGDIVYVRGKGDLASPLRIEQLVRSRQVLEWAIARSGVPYLRRVPTESDGRASNAAQTAIAYSRLGPVLVFAPTRPVAEEIARHISALRDEMSVDLTIRQQDALQLIAEQLTPEHPIIQCLRRRTGFHHAQLTKDVRGEIEYLFESRAVDILVATQTLIDGVNFPIKTLILSDYCSGRWYDKAKGEKLPSYPLDKREFRNMVGRAGRALTETEGQVIVLQSVDDYPFALDRGFADYLDIGDDDPALFISSSLNDNRVLDLLIELVDAFDRQKLDAEHIVFESRALPSQMKPIKDLVRKLSTLTILLEAGDIRAAVSSDRFRDMFVRSFVGQQRADLAPALLSKFAGHVSKATDRRLSPEMKARFSKTGLPLSVCWSLYNATKKFWLTTLSPPDLAQSELNGLFIEKIAAIVYSAGKKGGLGPSKVRPRYEGEGSVKGVDVPHPEKILTTWIHTGSPQSVISTYFSFCEGGELRASAFSEYLQETLNYRTPWLLSSFWMFSRDICAELGTELSDTMLGKELSLFAAYAKFGVRTPFAALASTLGVSPPAAARVLSDEYSNANPIVDRYDFPRMYRWLTSLFEEDMLGFGLAPVHVRRIVERLSGLAVASEPDEAFPNDLSFAIAGWQYYQGEEASESLSVGDRLTLVPEDDNRYDANAVVLLTMDGRKAWLCAARSCPRSPRMDRA